MVKGFRARMRVNSQLAALLVASGFAAIAINQVAGSDKVEILSEIQYFPFPG